MKTLFLILTLIISLNAKDDIKLLNLNLDTLSKVTIRLYNSINVTDINTTFDSNVSIGLKHTGSDMNLTIDTLATLLDVNDSNKFTVSKWNLYSNTFTKYNTYGLKNNLICVEIPYDDSNTSYIASHSIVKLMITHVLNTINDTVNMDDIYKEYMYGYITFSNIFKIVNGDKLSNKDTIDVLANLLNSINYSREYLNKRYSNDTLLESLDRPVKVVPNLYYTTDTSIKESVVYRTTTWLLIEKK